MVAAVAGAGAGAGLLHAAAAADAGQLLFRTDVELTVA